jgi:hypothetical protein
VYVELAQKLNRRVDSVKQWFEQRRAKERKQMDEGVEKKTTRRKTKGKNAKRKLKTGKFCEKSQLILLASFEANPYPDRQKLFYRSQYVDLGETLIQNSLPSFYNNFPKRWIPRTSNEAKSTQKFDQALVSG